MALAPRDTPPPAIISLPSRKKIACIALPLPGSLLLRQRRDTQATD